MANTKRIEIDTPKGKLIAELSPDPNYPGIVICWDEQQVALIDCPSAETIQAFGLNENPSEFQLRVWDHDDNNDPSHEILITKWKDESNG